MMLYYIVYFIILYYIMVLYNIIQIYYSKYLISLLILHLMIGLHSLEFCQLLRLVLI